MSINVEPNWLDEGDMTATTDIDLKVSPTSNCVFDTFSIGWRVDAQKNPQLKNVQMIHVSSTTRDGKGAQSALASPIGALYAFDGAESAFLDEHLRCADSDNIFCQPGTKAITLLSDQDVIDVVLDRNGTRPTIRNVADVLVVEPSLKHPAFPQWVNPARLHVHIDREDMQNLVDRYQSGNSVVIGIRAINTTLDAFTRKHQKTVRATREGTSTIFFVDTVTKRRVSNIQTVVTSQCSGIDTLPIFEDLAANAVTNSTKKPPTRQFHLAGVYPLTGMDPVKVTHNHVPAMVRTLLYCLN